METKLAWQSIKTTEMPKDIPAWLKARPVLLLDNAFDSVQEWLTPVVKVVDRYLECNCTLCKTESDFFNASKRELHFPDYFGMNWSAFNDCATEFDFVQGKSLVILWRGFQKFADQNPAAAAKAVEICQRKDSYEQKDIAYIFVAR